MAKNDFDHPRTVWTAELTDPKLGSSRLRLSGADDGYIIVSHLGGGFVPNAHYMFVDATDQHGVNALATVNDFHGSDLREGMIRDDRRSHDLQGWLGSKGPKCH
ncbi:MAG: hypothetical protein M3N98_08365 [Actinomycetota bacterium]|nr:hypothetical protein [Actinomycetota bacterium]